MNTLSHKAKVEMVEKENSSLKNLFGIYNPTYSVDDPSMNVSVNTSRVGHQLSPYLSVDPYIASEPEFILPEGSGRQRGRFEYAFGSIGGSVLAGAGVGSISGLYKGWRDTQGQIGKVRRTQLLNYVGKHGAATANSLGVMALMYSGFGVLLSYARGVDDEYNTVASATATGLLYKSSAGLKRCGIAGGVGFGLASLYILWAKGSHDRSIADYVGSTSSRHSHY